MSWKSQSVRVFISDSDEQTVCRWDGNAKRFKVFFTLSSNEHTIEALAISIESAIRNLRSENFVFRAPQTLLDRFYEPCEQDYQDLLRFVDGVNCTPSVGPRIGIRLNPRFLRRESREKFDSDEFCLVTTDVIVEEFDRSVGVGQFFTVENIMDGAIDFTIEPSDVPCPAHPLDKDFRISWTLTRKREVLGMNPHGYRFIVCEHGWTSGFFVPGIENKKLVFTE